jgi:alkanesulfonate monooxygenase
MPVEVIGLLYHRPTSQIRDVPDTDFDLGYLHELAAAHERSGYDSVLVSQNASMADPLMIASYIAPATTKLNFMLAHRPGFIAPTMAARMFATIDRLSGGRASVHIISGAHDSEMARDGDWLTKDQRYRRSREYAQIMRAMWTADAPIDHEGEFYRFRQAFCDIKPTRPNGLSISWAGASQLALETAGECADVYAMVGDAPDAARDYLASARREAARHGRSLKFTITMCVILGDTEQTAWRNAHAILAEIETRLAARKAASPNAEAPKHASVAFQNMLDRALQSDIVGKNLWLAINRVTGAASNNTTIVGTVEQVVETLMLYRAIGFDSFLLRGFNPLEDAKTFGSALIPHLRETVARQDANEAR